MGEYIGIRVRNTEDAPLLPYSSSQHRILGYVSLMLRSFFICVPAGMRILLADPSAFGNNIMFTTSSIVALFGIALVFSVLLKEHSDPLEDNSYTIVFKFIGSFSAFLGPFSLLMVIVLPPELNWIGFLVACAMLGLIVTCFRLDDQRDVRPSVWNDLMLYTLLFVVLMSVLFPPTPRISRVMYEVIKVCLWIENAYHLITYLRFIYEKTRKPKAIQQDDENNIYTHESHLSYLMPLGSPSF